MSETLTSAFSTALDTIQTDVGSIIAIALPIGLAIMGIFIAIRLGIRFFRSIAKQYGRVLLCPAGCMAPPGVSKKGLLIMVGFIIFLLLLLFLEIVGIAASVYFVAVRVKKRMENPEASSFFRRKKNNTVQDLKDAVAVKELLEKLGGSDSEAVREIMNAAAEQPQ